MNESTQYLIRTASNLDYARVEPWQGGLEAAKREARSIKGYVEALDEYLCRTGAVVADYRAEAVA